MRIRKKSWVNLTLAVMMSVQAWMPAGSGSIASAAAAQSLVSTSGGAADRQPHCLASARLLLQWDSSGTVPAAGALGVDPNIQLQLRFDTPVEYGGSIADPKYITLKRVSDNATVGEMGCLSITCYGGDTVIIPSSGVLSGSTSYYVLVDERSFKSGDLSFSGIRMRIGVQAWIPAGIGSVAAAGAPQSLVSTFWRYSCRQQR